MRRYYTVTPCLSYNSWPPFSFLRQLGGKWRHSKTTEKTKKVCNIWTVTEKVMSSVFWLCRSSVSINYPGAHGCWVNGEFSTVNRKFGDVRTEARLHHIMFIACYAEFKSSCLTVQCLIVFYSWTTFGFFSSQRSHLQRNFLKRECYTSLLFNKKKKYIFTSDKFDFLCYKEYLQPPSATFCIRGLNDK